MEEAVVGIDLGTTNSCVATITGGRPKIIEDERGYNILPSCVAFKAHGKFVVGHGAKALILTNPTQTVYAVKRLIGRKFSSPEVQEARKRLSYEIFQGEADDVILRLGEVELTPEEVSSIVLKCAREVAERSLGRSVSQAVVTVPAYFNHAQRKATLHACELAGLDCLRLLNEPTAAALAYGFKKDLEKKVAIYDLGGGTFDISILEIGGGIYETLGTSGNTFLGGEDFDYRIVDYLADQFRQQHGVDLRDNAVSMQRLKDASERAKCELSFVDKTPILIPRVHDNLNLEMSLNRTTLEGLVDDLVRESVKITSEALNEANISIEELDEIILVGGMTRMPKIQESIRVFFGMAPCKGVHPEEVVATGAAVQAYSLEEEVDNHVLLDVTPFSLGIDTAGGYFSKVIDRNTTLPVGQGRTFTTVTDNQEVVKIVVRQGESDSAADNEFLGEFSLEGIRPAPRMTPRVDVDFKIDANGILHVAATDRDTGEQQMVTIRDFVDKAAAVSATDIQLAADLAAATTRALPRESSAARPAGASGSDSGLFGRLKGLFGKAAPDGGDATDVQDRQGRVDDTSIVDRSSLVAETDVQARGGAQFSVPSSLDLRERGGQQDHRFPDSLPAATPDAGIAEQLKASLGETFGRTDPASSEVKPRDIFGSASPTPEDKTDPYGIVPTGWAGTSPTGQSIPPTPEDKTDPYGIAPAGWSGSGSSQPPARVMATPPAGPAEPYGIAPAGWSEDDKTEPGRRAADSPFAAAVTRSGFAEQPTSPSIQGDGGSPFAPGHRVASDPFALQDRSAPDPFDLDDLGESSDPFAIRDAGSAGPSRVADPFGTSEPSHSRRMRKVDTRASTSAGITPASFNLAENPQALAASKKRPARLKIRYKRARTFVKEFTENLERGGTFVKTSSPLEVGRRCIFELRLPDDEEPLRIQGMVVWSSRGIDRLPEGQDPGMGIQYDDDDVDGVASVRAAVERFADS